MKGFQVHFGDWKRLLFGDAPLWFPLEVLVRTLLTYVVLLFLLRIIGKRMAGQLTIVELAIMILLGATVAVPIQTFDRGLLQGFLILFTLGASLIALNRWTESSLQHEQTVYGHGAVLIRDGVIDTQTLNESRITRDELFSILRKRAILHLGQVKRLYLEDCGLFSLYRWPGERAGLSVFPHEDTALVDSQPRDFSRAVCSHCGLLAAPPSTGGSCPHCKNRGWEPAAVGTREAA